MSAATIEFVTNVSFALITFASGALTAIVPWLTRRREAFAVTIPESAQADPRIRALRRLYCAAVLAISAGAAAFVPHVSPSAHPLLLTAVICLPFAAAFILMLMCRGRVRALKRAEGWGAHADQASAFVAPAGTEIPRALSLSWSLIYVPIILATLAISLALYPAMPDPVAVHFNAQGMADNFIDKGWQIIAMPAAIQAFVALCLVASHWTIIRSKRPASSEAPVASALAYGMFARAQSVVLLFTGVLVLAAMALFPFTCAGLVTPMESFIAIMAIVAIACAASFGVSIVYGQSGSRLLRRMTAANSLSFDDDAYWKAGVFYVSREDPAVILPKRFGVGWAMNWGNPRSWLLCAGLILAAAAFIVALAALGA